ncbi:hypothetical protein DPMN_135864 [Dreissena polymorpha]|uniref:Uncharacterized protein n=1 Tax=Dreissena polymorpha TaxID=45954 RepID=A0A9D4FYT1_DREPO|nr:hypothetical protein DPMN_135864 [Dreissena polymorpha]
MSRPFIFAGRNNPDPLCEDVFTEESFGLVVLPLRGNVVFYPTGVRLSSLFRILVIPIFSFTTKRG